MPSVSLNHSFEICRQITRHHAKSFYFASHTLPQTKRYAAYAIYAFCRHVDDEVDLAPSLETKIEAVERLKLLVGSLFESARGYNADFPWRPAFEKTVAEYQIPSSYFYDLLHGVAMDQGPVRIQNWEELDRYCYHVASVVGLIMTRIFVGNRPELETAALNLGTAMQLTNILRDISEDLANDRVYIPKEDLDRFGVTVDDLWSGRATESFRGLMRFEIGRAREYYSRSERGIRQLPRDGTQWTVWMMREIYAGILDEIEKRDGYVFHQRVHVSTPRKVWLALKAWRRSVGSPKVDS